MITKGLGTNSIITKGFGEFISFWREKIAFSLNIIKKFKISLER